MDTLVSGSFVPVELKAIADWPAKAATKVLGRSGLSQVQKNWHLNWRRWGGRSLIVVEVKDEVFTFNGSTADHVNDYNTRNFRSAAVVVGIEATVDLLVGLSQKGKDED